MLQFGMLQNVSMYYETFIYGASLVSGEGKMAQKI